MLKKLTTAGLALASLFAVAMTSSLPTPAEAGGGGRFAAGVATGIIGLGVLGALSHAHEPPPRYYYRSSCHPGPEECGWRDRRCFENSWGDMVCRGGRWTCWRPTYCD